jgi:hypothetical protein
LLLNEISGGLEAFTDLVPALATLGQEDHTMAGIKMCDLTKLQIEIGELFKAARCECLSSSRRHHFLINNKTLYNI